MPKQRSGVDRERHLLDSRVGALIHAALKRAKLPLARVSQHYGLSDPEMGRWLRGAYPPPHDLGAVLARLLHGMGTAAARESAEEVSRLWAMATGGEGTLALTPAITGSGFRLLPSTRSGVSFAPAEQSAAKDVAVLGHDAAHSGPAWGSPGGDGGRGGHAAAPHGFLTLPVVPLSALRNEEDVTLAEQHAYAADECVHFPLREAAGRDLLAVRVEGDCMSAVAGIEAGDVVVVDAGELPADGDVVVVTLPSRNGLTVIKGYFRSADSEAGYELRPDTGEAIHLEPDERPRMRGVVIGLWKNWAAVRRRRRTLLDANANANANATTGQG